MLTRFPVGYLPSSRKITNAPSTCSLTFSLRSRIDTYKWCRMKGRFLLHSLLSLEPTFIYIYNYIYNPHLQSTTINTSFPFFAAAYIYQSTDKRTSRGKNLFSCFKRVKILDAIHFGKGFELAGVRRPLHLEPEGFKNKIVR